MIEDNDRDGFRKAAFGKAMNKGAWCCLLIGALGLAPVVEAQAQNGDSSKRIDYCNELQTNRVQTMKIEKIDYYGMEALAFEAGGYEAMMIPSVGANVVKLFHRPTGVDILRTPTKGEVEEFCSRPQIYGLPLLFPPNRIADGRYTFEGRTYRYPITIPAQNNYHHGIIKSQPFVITRAEMCGDAVKIEASFFSNDFQNPIFVDFPHAFECRMLFELSAEGLKQTTVFVNRSDKDMPLGVGFHTPINVPFVSGADRADYRLRLSVGKRWEVDGRTLPTERLIDLSAEETSLREGGVVPCGNGAIETPFTNESILLDGKAYNGAVLSDLKNNLSVCYEVDENYQHWTLWNNGGEVPYVCPEPQTWAINAPNLSLPKEITGFRCLEPGKEWAGVTKLYVVKR